MIRIGTIELSWTDLAELLSPVARIALPVGLAIVGGLLCMFLVARILRMRFGIRVSLAAAQIAGIAAGIAFLWGSFSPWLAPVKPVDWAAFGIQSEPQAASEGPFSTDGRCRWYADELARIRGTAIASGNATTLEAALKAKATQDDCMSAPKEHYPSRKVVESYLFRLNDVPSCAWAKSAFLVIAAGRDAYQASGLAQANWRKAQEAGCARY
jgi:hypothetical protein